MSPRKFQLVCRRLEALGDGLNDAELLEVADIFHEQLRARRAVRHRHPTLAPELRSFLNG